MSNEPRMRDTAQPQFDVAIIGGGPGGSTLGTLLRKYNPSIRVLILEKETFPRDHIGESQLPPISRVLHEMGVWDKVEAADFPVKIGASYTWGMTTEPWEFEFIPLDMVRDETRPAPYAGWRRGCAFQVDRSIYDEILLNHAGELGCEVRQATRVAKVHHDGDRVTALELADGSRVTAKHYVDASGNAAVLRRDLGIQVHAPTMLQNVAFWDYWTGATLNADLFGHGVTRVQIRSLPYGWLWYIPLSRTRTSVGLVCPADYYKKAGKRPEQLYHEALQSEPRVAQLLQTATPRGKVERTIDWSYVSERTTGENWFLVGEALGFADPILSAGLTLTHSCGRHCAYTILELERGEHDPAWLKKEYDQLQRRHVRQHMRFAEYWYSANGCFDVVREYCSQIARDSGFRLNASSAFRWISNGGLEDEPGQAVLGGFNVTSIKQVQWRLIGERDQVEYSVNGKNVFKLNLANAREITVARLSDGRIHRARAWTRAGRTLYDLGFYAIVIDALREGSNLEQFAPALERRIVAFAQGEDPNVIRIEVVNALETMVNDHWVICDVRKGRPVMTVRTPKEGKYIYSTNEALKKHGLSPFGEEPSARSDQPG